ncbi:hypothetical protein L198_07921 [Cryptococcus wingfieldii CBS 7118]|uniref:Uncharacterized protein n=1 Tax=Cryptococcus wingfieldii CBS 7118 TaxID=1295528 RepID=A0A1E3HUL4_9TREE|nr:hypothetical protein L198_07921 [Cryptococcus wingfieldii CBS 7118]ODN79171.1 hypothetical protein L198_07921 [Cryptococcus wingfieldii CBS 7118]
MCANNVPHDLIIEILQDAVADIKRFRDRAKQGRLSKADKELVELCNDSPFMQLVRAGFNTNPLLLDVAAILECRALQDLSLPLFRLLLHLSHLRVNSSFWTRRRPEGMRGGGTQR